MIKENILQDKKREIEYTDLLKDYISFLKDQIINQNKFIFDHLNTIRSSQGIQVETPKDINEVSTPRVNTLIGHDSKPPLITNDNINVITTEYIDVEKDDKRWITEKRKNKIKNNTINTSPSYFESINNFNLLDHDEIAEINNTDNTVSLSKTAEFKSNKKITNKSKLHINQFPDHDVLLQNNVTNVLPKTVATKCVTISDSITKRIDMREFDKNFNNGSSVKRVFPGATASQINSHVPTILKDDLPDTVIICAGTNNIMKKKQTINDTAKEIINIAKSCCKGGVKYVLISSLTCRPSYQKDIEEINKILNHYASIYNYVFIDNKCISKEHLWKDGLHLNKKGIILLANNYLTFLNRPSLLPFQSIWD